MLSAESAIKRTILPLGGGRFHPDTDAGFKHPGGSAEGRCLRPDSRRMNRQKRRAGTRGRGDRVTDIVGGLPPLMTHCRLPFPSIELTLITLIAMNTWPRLLGVWLLPVYLLSAQTFEVIPLNYTWKYNASSNDLGQAWHGTDYDDSAWDSGPAP